MGSAKPRAAEGFQGTFGFDDLWVLGGLGFRDEGLGFRVEGLGFRVEGLGFREVWGNLGCQSIGLRG